MKISLSAQIEEAEAHRDELLAQAHPHQAERLHRAESVCLTLRFVETYESEFRAFMKAKSKGH